MLNGGISQFVPTCPVLSPFVPFFVLLGARNGDKSGQKRTNGDKTGHFGTTLGKEQSRWKQTRWHTTKPLCVHLRGHPREHSREHSSGSLCMGYNTEKANFCGHSRVHLREHSREHLREPIRGSVGGSYFAFASSVLHWNMHFSNVHLVLCQFWVGKRLIWEKLNRGVSKPGGFPLFSGKVQIASRTLSGLFLVGALNRPRQRKRTNRENPRTIPEQCGKIPEKSGKPQKGQKKTRLKPPRLAALD